MLKKQTERKSLKKTGKLENTIGNQANEANERANEEKNKNKFSGVTYLLIATRQPLCGAVQFVRFLFSVSCSSCFPLPFRQAPTRWEGECNGAVASRKPVPKPSRNGTVAARYYFAFCFARTPAAGENVRLGQRKQREGRPDRNGLAKAGGKSSARLELRRTHTHNHRTAQKVENSAPETTVSYF